MSPNQSDVTARLRELEATVRGLTLELVEANERIRELEAAVDGGPVELSPADAGGPLENGETDGAGGQTVDAGARSDDAGCPSDGGGTKQMGGDDEPDDEADSGLDDIIVA